MFIVYEANGNIIMTSSEDYEGAKCMNYEVPEGYEVASIDPETGEPVLVEKPKTEAERIAELEAQMAVLAGQEGN